MFSVPVEEYRITENNYYIKFALPWTWGESPVFQEEGNSSVYVPLPSLVSPWNLTFLNCLAPSSFGGSRQSLDKCVLRHCIRRGTRNRHEFADEGCTANRFPLWGCAAWETSNVLFCARQTTPNQKPSEPTEGEGHNPPLQYGIAPSSLSISLSFLLGHPLSDFLSQNDTLSAMLRSPPCKENKKCFRRVGVAPERVALRALRFGENLAKHKEDPMNVCKI